MSLALAYHTEWLYHGKSPSLWSLVMDDLPCRRFFLEPSQPLHRRYAALRAYFVDGLSLQTVAEQFDSTYHTVRSWVRDFRAHCQAGQLPPFSPSRCWGGPGATRFQGRRLDRKNRPLLIVASSVWHRAGNSVPGSLACSSFFPC
jgi:hypothetical protein